MITNLPQNSVPDISIENLTLDYQHQRLFDQLNLFLPARSWTCLLGASGVGKSTLLRALADLPTGTDHKRDTKTIRTSDGCLLKGRIAYMAQQDLLMPWLTALDNTLIGHRLRGEKVSIIERDRASSLLKQVGLEKSMFCYPAQLSGGMRQRVALARTLLEDRPIVLMDEPFSALDAVTRLRLQDLAAQLLQGKTVLLVTHDPLEALRLGGRIYVLRGAPAVLHEAFILEDPRPRSPAEPKILQQQAELFRLLTV